MAGRAFCWWVGCVLVGLGLVTARPALAAGAPGDPSGDPSGDWPRAVRLVQGGQPAAALPLLERLVAARPADKDYRFELALALYRLNRDFRAKWHFDLVRGANLSAAEAKLVEDYLGHIEARRRWSGYFGLRLRPETNVGKQTSDDTINVGGLDFTLNKAARGRPGTSAVVDAGLGWRQPISLRAQLRLNLDSHLRYNPDRALRDYRLYARAGLALAPDARRRIEGGVILGRRWVAERPYSRSTGVWLEQAMLVGQAGRLELEGQITRTRYQGGGPDSRSFFLSASYSRAISGNAQLSLSGFWERTDSAQRTLAGHRHGLSASGVYLFGGGLIAGLRIGWQDDRRRGPEPAFGVARHDRNLSLDLSFHHQNIRIGNFAPELVIGVERNRSNIPLADYVNRYVSIGLTRNF